MGGQMMMQQPMMHQQPMMMQQPNMMMQQQAMRQQQPVMRQQQQQPAPAAVVPQEQQPKELFDGSVVSSKTSAKL
jgi:hypothetical protein